MMSAGDYFMSVVLSSVIAALVGMLYPDDKGGVKKTIDFAIALFLLCVIIAPIGSMLAKANEIIDFDIPEIEPPNTEVSAGAAIYGALAAEGGEAIEKRFGELICDSLKIAADEISVSAEVRADDNGIIIDKVTVWLYGKAMWSDPRVILELIADYTDAECLIVNGG